MIKKYLKSHEEHAISPLTISPNHHAWASPIITRLLGGLHTGVNTFCIHEDHGLQFYADGKAWDKGSDLILKKFAEDTKLIAGVKNKSEELARALLKMIRFMTPVRAEQMTNAELAAYFTKSYALASDFCAYGFIPLLSDHLFHKFTHKLKHIAKHRLEVGNFEYALPEMVQLLTSPTKAMPSRQARGELLGLVLKYRGKLTSRAAEVALRNYHERWYWVNFGQLGPEPKLIETKNAFKKLATNLAATRVEQQVFKRELPDLRKQQVVWFKRLQLSSVEQRLFNTAQIGTYLKGLRLEILFGVYASWGRILNVAAKRLGVPKELLYYCSTHELASWLMTGKAINIKVLKERKKFCVWVATSVDTKLALTGKAAKKYIKDHAAEEKISDNEVLFIHGTVASLGFARGQVKIVNKTSEIGKVNKGDIMVSVATNPSLLPAMQRAAAFVTDSGGITSHAAIVARELKKPCIIGTRIATKVLKDGDLVEIDTRKGDVRKV